MTAEAPGEEGRSEDDIARLQSARNGVWRVIRWIRKRRPLLTALFVLAAPLHTLLSGTRPLDMLVPSWSPRFVAAWLLVVFGVAVRLWGSGNLHKNKEITDTGVYQLVRHPLYLGSLCFLLAYFLTVGDARVGAALFAGLLFLVYYPTMLSEEEYLTLKFPLLVSRYDAPPRLVPDLRRLPEALRTDRFRVRAAYGNLGFRGLWFLIGLPLFLKLLSTVQSAFM